MFYVEQLPFLHTLGYAIGHSLWQMSLVWLVYTAVINVHKWSSTQRYNLAVGGVLAGIVCFAVTLAYFNLQSSTPEAVVVTFSGTDTLTASPANRFLFFYHSLMASLRSLAPYFSCAYLLVMLLLSTRLINGFRQVKLLKTNGLSKAPVEWRLFVNDHASLLGIPKKVLLQVSSITTSPLTIGYLKPMILIPLASINNLTPSQLEAVLLHELAHIRRNDYLTNIFLQLAEIVLFFNPFMRLLLKHARIERENCCDDCVLQFRYNAADYAKALLSIQQHSAGNMLTLGISNKNEFQLLNRVKRMLAPERKSFNYRQQLGLLFLLTLIGLGFTVINPKPKLQPVVSVLKKDTLQQSLIDTTRITAVLDLVKNIQNIGNALETGTSAKNKHIEIAIEHSAKELEKQMAPHLQKIEAAAKSIDLIATNANNQLVNNINEADFTLNNPSVWLKQLPAFITQGVKLPGLKDIEKSGAELAKIAELADSKDQQAALEKIQLTVKNEQKKLEVLTRNYKLTADSLGHAYKISRAIANEQAKDAERAAKEIAIAPFRVRRNVNTSTTKGNLTFSFFPEADEAAPAYAIAAVPAPQTPPATIVLNGNNCNCPDAKRGTATTITVVNGKQLAAKVKKVWAEAQLELKNSWTPDMQQKILNEIKLELKSPENIEIKTHVNAANNGRSFVIEVETSE